MLPGVRALLLESEDQECPKCHEKGVSPDTLIPNRFLRQSVIKFRSDTGYTKSQPSLPPPQPAATEPKEEPDVETKVEPKEEHEAAHPPEDSLQDVGQALKKEELEEKEEPELILEAEEFKFEATASPAAASVAENEETSEPPPPGGEAQEEGLSSTPTVDEKPPGETESQPEAVSRSPSVPAKASAPPPTHNMNNNLAMLAQKTPSLAFAALQMQHALFQGNPLLGLGIFCVRIISWHLIIEICICLCSGIITSKHSATGPHTARIDGDARSKFLVCTFAAYTHLGSDLERSDRDSEFGPHPATHVGPATNTHTSSGIPSIAAAASLPRSFRSTTLEPNDAHWTPCVTGSASDGVSRAALWLFEWHDRSTRVRQHCV